MSNKNISKLISGSALALSLVFTSGFKGCGSDKKKETDVNRTSKETDTAKKSGPILCSINGKPSIYESDFIKSINQMMQQNPYFRGANIESLPSELKRKLLDKLIDQELVLAKAYETKITEGDEFKTAYKEMMQLVEKSLAIQFFEKSIFDKIHVSNEAVEKNYNESKERYVKVAGGILASGAKFESDTEATKFIEKVQIKPSNFDKIAKETKGAKFKHFGRVNQAAQGFDPESIPEQVKVKLLAVTTFPHIEKVTIGKDNVWVIAAFEKQDTVYFPLDEIRKQLEDHIKNNDFAKTYEDQLKDLRKSMTVDVNKEYFKDAAPEAHANEHAEEDAMNNQEAPVTQSSENNNSAAAAA